MGNLFYTPIGEKTSSNIVLMGNSPLAAERGKKGAPRGGVVDIQKGQTHHGEKGRPHKERTNNVPSQFLSQHAHIGTVKGVMKRKINVGRSLGG